MVAIRPSLAARLAACTGFALPGSRICAKMPGFVAGVVGQ